MKDKKYGWPTTRRFPNTLAEAFPDDAENARWWYPPQRSTVDKIVLTVAAIAWIAIGIYFWKTWK